MNAEITNDAAAEVRGSIPEIGAYEFGLETGVAASAAAPEVETVRFESGSGISVTDLQAIELTGQEIWCRSISGRSAEADAKILANRITSFVLTLQKRLLT
jgi:hypothetical protein